VHPGTVLEVATMDAEPGSRVELRDVLLVSDGDSVTVGSPNVADALVVAEVIEHGKGRKVVNFKYKAKVRYRRKRGHRQGFTRLAIQEISLAGKTESAPVRRRAAAPAGFAGRVEPDLAPAEPLAEAPVAEAEAAPTPRRGRVRASAETAPEATTETLTEATAEQPAPRTRRRRPASEPTESNED
jgi:large subunit ribosomal protein L21